MDIAAMNITPTDVTTMTEIPTSRRRIEFGEPVVRHHSPYCEATGPIVERGTVAARVRELQEAYKKSSGPIRSHIPQRHRLPCTRHSGSESSSDLELVAPNPVHSSSLPSRHLTKASIHEHDTRPAAIAPSVSTPGKTKSFISPSIPSPFLRVTIPSDEHFEAQTPNISALLEEMMETEVRYMEEFAECSSPSERQKSHYEVVDPWGPSVPMQYSPFDIETQSGDGVNNEVEGISDRIVDFTKPMSMHRKSIADQLGQMIDEALEERTNSADDTTRRYRSRSTSADTSRFESVSLNQEPLQYTESLIRPRLISQNKEQHACNVLPSKRCLDPHSITRSPGRKGHRRSATMDTALRSDSDSSPISGISYPITNRYIMTKAIPPSHDGLDYTEYDHAHHPPRESTDSYSGYRKKSARVFPVLRSRRSVQGTLDSPRSRYAGSIFVHNFQKNEDVIEQARQHSNPQSHKPGETDHKAAADHKAATRRLSRPWRWWRLALMDRQPPGENLRSGPETKVADQNAERTRDLDSNEAEAIEEIVNVLSHYADQLSTSLPSRGTRQEMSTSRSVPRLGGDGKHPAKGKTKSPVEMQPMNATAISGDGSSDTLPSTGAGSRNASVGFQSTPGGQPVTSAQITAGDAPISQVNREASRTLIGTGGGSCYVNFRLAVENMTVDVTIENAANTKFKVEFQPRES